MHYLIFMDVDGVINSMSFYDTVKSITENPLDPEAIKRVKRLIELSEQGDNTVHVILTSSWRYGWNRDPKLRDVGGKIVDTGLAMYGIKLYDKTGVSETRDRPGEVLEYLRKYPYHVDGFVILDDANFFWEKYRLSEWWVKTDPKVDGFRESMIDPALSMLRNPPWWLRLINIGKKKYT